MIYDSNSLNGGPKVIDGDNVKAFDNPEHAAEWLAGNGVESVQFDADGNGSMVEIPTEWIGDGERLANSERVMSLVR